MVWRRHWRADLGDPHLGGYPDAVAFAVLLMNLCAPFIDLHTRAPAFGQRQPEDRR